MKLKDGQSRVSHHETSKDMYIKNNISSQGGYAKILKSLFGDIISRKRSLVRSLWDGTEGEGRKLRSSELKSLTNVVEKGRAGRPVRQRLSIKPEHGVQPH